MTTGSRTPGVADAGRRHVTTLAALAVAALAYALMASMVSPALPVIQRDLGVSRVSVTWVMTIYLVSASVAAPIVGRLGDMYGRKTTLVVVVSVFAVGSLISALAETLWLLLVGRAVEGSGGAVFMLAFGIIRDELPRGRVALAIGSLSATLGVGGIVGLLLTGVLVDQLSYHWIFWFGVVVALVGVVAAQLFVPDSPVRSPARIDWAGAFLFSAWLVSLLVAVSEASHWGWDSSVVLGLLATAVLGLGAWLRHEWRVPTPLIDVRLLRARALWTTNLTALLAGFGMVGAFILVPQFVQMPTAAGYGFGADVMDAGLFMLPSAIAILGSGPVGGALTARWGSRIPLVLGTGCMSIGLATLSLAHDEPWQIVTAVALVGGGMACAFAAMVSLVVAAVSQRQTGEATGVYAIMRTIGGALGAQVCAAIVAANPGRSDAFPAERGFTLAFAAAAVAVVLASLVALLLIPAGTADSRHESALDAAGANL